MKEKAWFSWKMQTSKTWSDMSEVLKYTKIDFVDYDHKILVEYALKLNHLIIQMDTDFSLELLQKTGVLLEDLYRYAVEHFKREEDFMDAYNLPEVKRHKIVHAEILKTLADALADFKNGRVRIGYELRSKITEWLIFHINEFDLDFFALDNWSDHLIEASSWDDIKDIISSIGLVEIDRQHKALTSAAIDMFSVFKEGGNSEEFEEAFTAFEQLVIDHFDYEQEFMKTYQIKEKHNHRGEHDYFKIKIKEQYQFLLDHPQKFGEVKKWLLAWWINHINITDLQTFDYKNWAQSLIDRSESPEEMEVLLRRTDIKPIDREHLGFIHLTYQLNTQINTFNAKGNLNGPQAKETVLSTLEELFSLASHHFSNEERLMLKEGLSDLAGHKIEHEDILKRLRKIIDDYRDGRLYVSDNIKNMLMDWWINHTNTIDYRTFIIHSTDDQLTALYKEE